MYTNHPTSNTHPARSWFRVAVGVALPALACWTVWGSASPENVVFASARCTQADPGDGDYCASDECGPCAEGEGDCDRGQCQDGLECVEEGGVDRCRSGGSSGSSNLQVRIDGEWKGVCCDGHTPEVTDHDCRWTEHDRTLTDETEDLSVDCPEGGPAHCECNHSGERMHGTNDIDSSDGGPIYSNYAEETCVVVDSDGKLRTDWSSSDCPDFRLR